MFKSRAEAALWLGIWAVIAIVSVGCVILFIRWLLEWMLLMGLTRAEFGPDRLGA